MKKTIILVLIVVLIIGATGGTIAYWATRSNGSANAARGSLQRFASADDFIRAFKNGGKSQYGTAEDGITMKSASPSAATGTASESATPEHSTTNVQVEGVDEADLVKNDGHYIYAVSGDTVFIVAAYPSQEARVVSRIAFDKGAAPSEMFVLGDRLVVIGTSGYERTLGEKGEEYPSGNTTFIKVYDISNKDKPTLARTIEYEGTYSTARMIKDNVHVVLTTYPN